MMQLGAVRKIEARLRHPLAMLMLALTLSMIPALSAAQPQKMSASDAFTASQQGSLIILDIRRPAEWAETGVAKGAWPVSMHDAGFGATLQRILTQNPDTPVALICATGGRSNYVVDILEKNGISGVIDISEGMLGNGDAPGWIARKLTIVDAQTAKADFAAAVPKGE